MRDIDVATVFASGVTQVAAGDYRCCIQAEEYSGSTGDCRFCQLPAMPDHRVAPNGLLRNHS